MASTATRYSSVALVGLWDLVSGVAIAEVMSAVFGSEVLPKNPTLSNVFYLVFEVALQAVLTLWVGEEIRGVSLGENFVDPTGGILFILSVFRQPNFWARVDSLSDWASDKLLGFITGKDVQNSQDKASDFIGQQ